MSFPRLIFYNAMLGGWAALVGWLLSELLFLRRTDDVGWLLLVVTALVGAAVGGGIALLGPIANGRFQGQIGRIGLCVAGGFLGGILGGGIGGLLYVLVVDPNTSHAVRALLRALGWMFIGLGVGCVEGLLDRSPKKLRNGLIGGALGGLLGGLLFDPVYRLVGSDMSGRAVGFVVLGLCIGLFIGLAQIVLREAWLTVEEGFRPGRQLILDLPVTALGTSEKAQLPFIAFGAKGVEPIHAHIVRHDDGSYVLRDQGSRGGTLLNGVRVDEEVLADDDAIQLGPNVVRFHEVRRVGSGGEAPRRRGQPPPVPAAAAPAVAKAAPAVPVASIAPGPPPLLPKAAPAPPASRPQPAQPAPRPQPAPPHAVQTLPPKPAPMGPKGKPCPKCGKPATPIPGAAGHLCMSCDLRF
jgi:hypothetical protein